MAVISIPDVLKDKLGAPAAEALAGLLSRVDDFAANRAVELVEERFERRLAELETRLIKWMFIFWIGQFASIVGVLSAILFAFFRK